jgi:micrococcal nuclease
VILAVISAQLLSGCTSENTKTPSPAALAACVPAGQTPVEAKVVHIADGDTITIEIDKQDYRLRYIGINAPELDSQTQSELARESTEFNSSLVDHKTVTLYRDTSETDRYERLLRYVFVGDVFVNYELVRQGFARAQDYPPDSACKDTFAEAERLAQLEDLGIWAAR